MASTASLEGLKKAVFFPFEGKNWATKLLIGIVLGLGGALIVPAMFINRYSYPMMKRVISQDEDPSLPEWTDWGTLLVDGLKLWAVVVIYELPSIVLIFGGYFLSMALYFGSMVAWVPLTANSSSPTDVPVWPLFVGMGGMFGGIAIAMLGFALIFVSLIFIPPAVGNMIAKGEFSAAFRIKEWWPILKANLAGFFLAIVVALGLYSLLYFLVMAMYMTVVLCSLLPFVLLIVAFVIGLVTYALFAVAYRDGARKMAAAA